jgi:predicted nucleic acid-binding protein
MPKLPPWRPVAHRPPDLVLHTSLPLEWSGLVPLTQYANDMMMKLPRLVSAVPTLWSRRLADAVLTMERAGRITPQVADKCFANVYPFQVIIDPETPALVWTEIIDLARTQSVSVDDAAHLELALRLNLPLATTDAALTRAAGAAGVSIFTP